MKPSSATIACKQLSAEENRVLAIQYSAGNDQEKAMAITAIVAGNQALVLWIAAKIAKRYQVGLDDAVQYANLGLLKAITGYDLSLGYAFSTYAYKIIRDSTLAGAARDKYAVRFPRCHSDPRVAVSLDKAKADGYRVLDSLEASQDVPGYENEELRENVRAVMRRLNPRHREMLELKHGFADGRSWTVREIGAKFNVSHSRVHQIVQKSEARLRANLVALQSA